MRDDFCVFILSYDRPERVKTLRTLDKYSEDVDRYVVVNHPDDVEPYEAEHGEDTVVYLPDEGALPETDRGDNFERHDTPLYTRNQLWDLADDLGYDYFMVLDDDYSFFQWRFNEAFEYEPRTPSEFGFDRYVDAAIEYVERADLDCLCMAQGGDFIGGSEGSFAQKVATKRKAMNTFLLRTDRPFQYRGTLNDDVNTYVRAGQLGTLFLTVNVASVEQEGTQQEAGGLTDAYLEEGTYVKSFYTILYAPSCTSLTLLRGRSAERVHHKISWDNAVPKIVPENPEVPDDQDQNPYEINKDRYPLADVRKKLWWKPVNTYENRREAWHKDAFDEMHDLGYEFDRRYNLTYWEQQTAEAWNEANPSTPEEIFEFYRGHEGYIPELSLWTFEGDKIDWLRRYKAWFIDSFDFDCQRVLDYGAGIGDACLYFNHFVDAYYCDVGGVLENYYTKRMDARNIEYPDPVQIEDPDWLLSDAFDAELDVVWTHDVIEHVPNPSRVLNGIIDAVRPGGYIATVWTFNDHSDDADAVTVPCHINDGRGASKEALSTLRESCDQVYGTWSNQMRLWRKRPYKER